MIAKRGEVWWADLNPIRGSEQAGVRPVLVLQNNAINKWTTTVLAVPLTTNMRRAALPSCIKLGQGDGGLLTDSVALCHQLRVLDATRLQRKLGMLSDESLVKVEQCVLYTLGIV